MKKIALFSREKRGTIDASRRNGIFDRGPPITSNNVRARRYVVRRIDPITTVIGPTYIFPHFIRIRCIAQAYIHGRAFNVISRPCTHLLDYPRRSRRRTRYPGRPALTLCRSPTTARSNFSIEILLLRSPRLSESLLLSVRVCFPIDPAGTALSLAENTLSCQCSSM